MCKILRFFFFKRCCCFRFTRPLLRTALLEYIGGLRVIFFCSVFGLPNSFGGYIIRVLHIFCGLNPSLSLFLFHFAFLLVCSPTRSLDWFDIRSSSSANFLSISYALSVLALCVCVSVWMRAFRLINRSLLILFLVFVRAHSRLDLP